MDAFVLAPPQVSGKGCGGFLHFSTLALRWNHSLMLKKREKEGKETQRVCEPRQTDRKSEMGGGKPVRQEEIITLLPDNGG